jgi:hypothetical protein
MRRPILTKLYGSIIHADPAPPSFKNNSDYLSSITLDSCDQQRLQELNQQRQEQIRQRALEKRALKNNLTKARKKAIHILSTLVFRQRLDRGDFPTAEELRLAYEPRIAQELIKLLQRKQQLADK